MSDTAWIAWDELMQQLDADTLHWLRPHLTHTGLDGQPCVEADRLDDLLGLLRLEQQIRAQQRPGIGPAAVAFALAYSWG